jgi:probable HAF family extracellular repeat protein
MQDLGTLGGSYSSADAITLDGTIIVGGAADTNQNTHAFRWVDGIGMQDIGANDGGYSYAGGVSQDGKVVTGWMSTGSFVWDEVNGMTSLTNRLLSQGANLTGWDALSIMGNGNHSISGDITNLSFIGQGNYFGNWSSFLITNFNGSATVVPEPSTLVLTGISAVAIGGYLLLKSRKKDEKNANLTVYQA